MAVKEEAAMEAQVVQAPVVLADPQLVETVDQLVVDHREAMPMAVLVETEATEVQEVEALVVLGATFLEEMVAREDLVSPAAKLAALIQVHSISPILHRRASRSAPFLLSNAAGRARRYVSLFELGCRINKIESRVVE